MEERRYLIDWFAAKNPVPGDTDEQKAEVDFFAAGLIDSFGVIELLSAVEEHFAIHFSDLHFQDRRFPFVGGLADIIREIREQEGHGQ